MASYAALSPSSWRRRARGPHVSSVQFDEDDLLDPCCAKEARAQRRNARRLAELRALDPTRIALEARTGVLSRPSRARLVGGRHHHHHHRCCLSDHADAGTDSTGDDAPCDHEECIRRDAEQRRRDGEGDGHDASDGAASDSSDDLDSMLDSFGLDADNDGEDDDVAKIMRRRREELMNAAAQATQATLATSGHADGSLDADGSASASTLRELRPRQAGVEIGRCPRLVLLLADRRPAAAAAEEHEQEQEGSGHVGGRPRRPQRPGRDNLDYKDDAFLTLDAVAHWLRVLAARNAETTTFCLLVRPTDADMGRLGVDRVPSLVCCVDGRVVARAERLEQFRGGDTAGAGVEVAHRLETWLTHARVVGQAAQAGLSRRRQRAAVEDAADESDDDDWQPSCGKAGCTKRFHHTHIEAGMCMDAEMLSVT